MSEFDHSGVPAIRCVAEDLTSIVSDLGCRHACLYVNVEDDVPYWEVIVRHEDGTFSTHHEFPEGSNEEG